MFSPFTHPVENDKKVTGKTRQINNEILNIFLIIIILYANIKINQSLEELKIMKWWRNLVKGGEGFSNLRINMVY
jgi:hypothetical protein